MLAVGGTGVPARGMGAVPAQLAATLPPGSVRLGTRVTAVAADGVALEDGRRIPARAVVVATDGPTAHALLGEPRARPGLAGGGVLLVRRAGPPARGRGHPHPGR